MTILKQQKEFFKTFSTHGIGDAQVVLSPKEVVLLIHLAHYDLNKKEADWYKEDIKGLLTEEYYTLGFGDINKIGDVSIEDAFKYLELSDATNPDNIIYLYLRNLCDLHRRRFKYRRILSTQPFPTVDQIGPRTLLEYGNSDETLLFNWLHWRKWIYDIDNRSAQETGYVFEPILRSCLGGESISHTRSPIKRLDAQEQPTPDGRQIDCFIENGEGKFAYELKLRVTIAASGQGRFNEEMSFPKEAKHAGITPVLIVLDPTPSALLTRLIKEYLDNAGKVFIGEDAWKILIETAGEAMGKFIENYIEPPIKAIEGIEIKTPNDILLSATDELVTIKDVSNDTVYSIERIKRE